MEYIGEHTFIGNLGQGLVSLAFVSALLMSISYLIAFRLKDTPLEAGWKKLGRISVWFHLIAVVGYIACMFVMLANNYFEYEYVFKHSSKEMPTKYILVAFWGGQQGSLMLWSFWNMVMVLLLRYSAKVGKMVWLHYGNDTDFCNCDALGYRYWPFHLGTSPFTLIREVNQELGMLWSRIPDYVLLTHISRRKRPDSFSSKLLDDHSSTHFILWFCTCFCPGSLCFAGLISRKYKEWITPALPWTYLAISILGTGILFGGAWAYESLNFGGFWAWDPVENASLIPWIFLVAGAHVMIITKKRGTARFSSALLILVAFWFVIYSSFLTRSGVLGEDSVHSFTGDGMSEELLLMQVFFIWLGIHAMMVSKKLRVAWAITSAVLLLATIILPIESVKVPVFVMSLLAMVIFTIWLMLKGSLKTIRKKNWYRGNFGCLLAA
jgi:cytochrome c-type biogenesis protein CcmF